MRHAGVHWPTGGEHPDRETIYQLPGVADGEHEPEQRCPGVQAHPLLRAHDALRLASSIRFWQNRYQT